MDPRATSLIERLGLAPHPEGGFYREHFRARETVDPRDGRGARAGLTAIHFLLAAGDASRWHAVGSAELWTFHEGDPLRLLCANLETLAVEEVRLGPASAGCAPSFAVPAGAWQAAEPAGAFALVSCAVGPGFDFADFRLLRDDPAARSRIETLLPRFVHLL
jgi:predicted cupin superfamily sugar epimerase